jgi:hypothetical protein
MSPGEVLEIDVMPDPSGFGARRQDDRPVPDRRKQDRIVNVAR